MLIATSYVLLPSLKDNTKLFQIVNDTPHNVHVKGNKFFFFTSARSFVASLVVSALKSFEPLIVVSVSTI